MSNRLPCLSRGLLVALAAIAVMFVLLRPACALWDSHRSGAGVPLAGAFSMDGSSQASGESSTRCCATVSDPTLGAVLQAANEVLDGPTAAVIPFAVFTGTALARQLLRLRAPPPHPRSYYVRSARILR